MPFPLLARKVKKFASQHLLQLKHLLGGRGFLKFKRLYRLKGALGHGGFGIVYRAERISDQLPVAVKFIERRNVREWGKLDDQKVPMEVAMLACCSDISGVIALIDWFALPEGFLIVMERPKPCMDLFDFIHHQKILDENLARFLFRPIVKAVIDLADRKVLHRDLKDENILINLANGQIKLIDFGAATVFTRNRCHDFQGTRLYCPPEWFLHSLYLGHEATVWSLGVLLFNMLNGRLPFLNEKDICTAHLLGPLPFFATLSTAARDLLAQCLSFEASSRPSIHQILAHPWLNDESARTNWCQLSACCSQLMTSKVEEKDDQGTVVTCVGHRDKGRLTKNGGRGEESGLAESYDERRLAGSQRNRGGKENGASFSRQTMTERNRLHRHSFAQRVVPRPSHTTSLSSRSAIAAPSNRLRITQTTNSDHFLRQRRLQLLNRLAEFEEHKCRRTTADDCALLAHGKTWRRKRWEHKQEEDDEQSSDSGTASALHSPHKTQPNTHSMIQMDSER